MKRGGGTDLLPGEQPGAYDAFAKQADAEDDAKWGKPTKADNARLKRDAAQRDQPPGGKKPAGSGSPPAKGPGPAARALKPVTSKFSGNDLAGGAMGALGYIIVINYLHGGLPQVRGWFAAKFLNRPYKPPAGAAGKEVGVAAPAATTLPPPQMYKNQ